MSEAGIRVTIRCNVDENNWDRIPRYLADLENGIAHKAHVSIYLSPLYAVRGGGKTTCPCGRRSGIPGP